jgi:3-methyladenine DNA glycosylase/8-oxoguanine DNA glycosylase
MWDVDFSPISGRFRPVGPLDLRGTLRPVRRGGRDPSFRVVNGDVWRATRTPLGPASERLHQLPDGEVEVWAWGPGAEWLIGHAPVLAGGLDDASGFRPEEPLLRELWRRRPGLRVCRTEAVVEAAMATAMEQKVHGMQAWLSWRAFVRRLGEPAPGPLPGLVCPPAAEVIARTPLHVFHQLGLEQRRAETVRRVAGHADRLGETTEMSFAEARRRLDALPGFGPWSAAEVALVALGDPDAVSVGDYHLPHLVSWALAGEPRGTDERMLELLEPYRGHRARVIRLLESAGIGPPRYGPRLPLRDVSSM